jgi:hypothetical protein
MPLSRLPPDAIHDRLRGTQAGLVTSSPVIYKADHKAQGAFRIRLRRIEGHLPGLTQYIGFAPGSGALAATILSCSAPTHVLPLFADNLLKTVKITNAIRARKPDSQRLKLLVTAPPEQSGSF